MSIRAATLRRWSLTSPLSKFVCTRLTSPLATTQVVVCAPSTATASYFLQNRNFTSVRAANSSWSSRTTGFFTQQRRGRATTPEAKTNEVDKRQIVSTTTNDKCKWLEVTWSDYLGRYPYVWMRDNCRCDECYYPSCHSRSMLMANLDLDVHPKTVEIKDDGHLVEILWSDGHISPYRSDWLKLQRFDKTDYDPIKKLSKFSWGSEFVNKIPTFPFDDVMTKNDALQGWMEGLVVYGLVKITGAPCELGALNKLCQKVAFERKTFYGPVYQVQSIFEPGSSLAYTAKSLGLHTDLPYYDYRPGVQMLHCIRQVESRGGENQFCDGKRAAEQLQREHPELFDILTKVKIDYRIIAQDYIDVHLQKAQNMIELDENGEFKYVAKSDIVRAPYLNVPVEDVAKVYKAMKAFEDAIYDENNFLDFKVQKGEIMAFDNNRVLHGRRGYSVSMEGEGSKSRLLEGAYLDWDEIYSRMRLIDEELRGTARL
ncbi:gamma-butyrobetaine dioxygenase-like [Diadema antillarum]|uniref:gamma-butyrobetaine dioxygenase-like n=1 Tax=Diadema antillarum TaxID=105358 RepID=UPI003A87D059